MIVKKNTYIRTIYYYIIVNILDKSYRTGVSEIEKYLTLLQSIQTYWIDRPK